LVVEILLLSESIVHVVVVDQEFLHAILHVYVAVLLGLENGVREEPRINGSHTVNEMHLASFVVAALDLDIIDLTVSLTAIRVLVSTLTGVLPQLGEIGLIE